MSMILAVAVGGALGAVARYLVSSWAMTLSSGGFPVGTLVVNIVGSFLMGVLIEVLAMKAQLPLEVRGLLVVGFLGAFTTFSTFALDFAVLQERGALLPAFGYVALSVLGSIGALFAALAIMRKVLT